MLRRQPAKELIPNYISQGASDNRDFMKQRTFWRLISMSALALTLIISRKKSGRVFIVVSLMRFIACASLAHFSGGAKGYKNTIVCTAFSQHRPCGQLCRVVPKQTMESIGYAGSRSMGNLRFHQRGNAISCLQLQLLPSMLSPHIHRMISLLYRLWLIYASLQVYCLQKSHFSVTG